MGSIEGLNRIYLIDIVIFEKAYCRTVRLELYCSIVHRLYDNVISISYIGYDGMLILKFF